MNNLKVYNGNGECVGEMPIAEGVLEMERGKQVLNDAVVAYLANQRAGTASTLTKGAVAGSNRKPWRQKGTGRARAGLRQSPVWRGGGVAFGPHPRSFKRSLPRRMARLAFRRAFSERVANQSVRVLDAAPEIDQPKTRLMIEWLRRQKASGAVLLILDRIDNTVRLAARNLPGIELATAAHVNTYQLMRHNTIFILREAMPTLTKRLGPREEASS